jgi:hypothetical protein
MIRSATTIIALFLAVELPAVTFDGLVGAASMGQFYNQNIKGSGADGPFDCRTHRWPGY